MLAREMLISIHYSWNVLVLICMYLCRGESAHAMALAHDRGRSKSKQGNRRMQRSVDPAGAVCMFHFQLSTLVMTIDRAMAWK
jgi:hypothetical protein